MRKVTTETGAVRRRLDESRALKTLALSLFAVIFACAAFGSGGQALARYSTMQAKMSGNYESFSVSPASRKRKNRNSGSYKKSNHRKTYKKNRTKKYSYGNKKKKTKSSYYKKSNSKKYTKYKSKKKYTKVAALSPAYVPKPKESLSGGGIRWAASSGCLNGTLKSVIYQVAAKYGPITVNSTCRSKKRNARVGGARKSHHLAGNAVDFRVHGNYGGAWAYLKSHGSVGGRKHYGGGLFHIDTGPRRSW